MEIIQIIIVLIGIFILTNIIINLAKGKNHNVDSLFWTIFWITTILITLIPSIAVEMAKVVGIGRGADLMIYLGVIFLAYMLFNIHKRINKMEQNVTKIIRTIAINKK